MGRFYYVTSSWLETAAEDELLEIASEMESLLDELKEQIEELMRQYADEEIEGDTYAQKMTELTISAQNDND